MPEPRPEPGGAPPPALSVVLVTGDGYRNVRKVIEHLRRQTARARLELVLVAPSRERVAEVAALEGTFAALRVVELGPIAAKDAAAAAGARAAAAPVVALIEDHAYPEPGWAAALLAAHDGPWAAVAPAIGNANPASPFSWANLLLSYGQWFAPERAGAVADVPAHNSSYKRDLLLACGPDLGRLLERGDALPRALTAAGHRLYLEPRARIDHVNVSRPLAALALRFHAARAFAAGRAREGRWSPAKRLLYIGATPLIPLLRLRYIRPFLRRASGARERPPRLWPALALLLVAHAVGELAGYAFGIGDALPRLAAFEFDRARYLTARDRRAEAD